MGQGAAVAAQSTLKTSCNATGCLRSGANSSNSSSSHELRDARFAVPSFSRRRFRTSAADPARVFVVERRRAGRDCAGGDFGKREGAGCRVRASGWHRASFFPEGEARRATLHGRRGEPHRPVRLQAGTGQAARPAVRLRRARRGVSERPRARGCKPVWDFKPYGQCGKLLSEVVAPLGDGRRRHRVRPQHGRQDRRPQPGHAAADDRLQPPRLPGHGLLGQLRPRQPEREPADVRRAARPSRAGVERHQELGHGVPARPAPGHGHLSRHARRRSPTCSRTSGRLHHAGGRRGRHRRCWHSSTASTPPTRAGDERLDARIRSYELAAKMQLAAPEALDISKEPAHDPRSSTASTTARRRSTRRSTPSRRRTTSAASAWSPGGCSSAACGSCRSGAGNDNGFPRRNWDSHEDVAARPRPAGARHGPRRGGAHPGPEAARPARRHDRPVDDRVRPHAVEPGRQGPRPQPVLLHQLAVRRRHQGRRHATARATSSATSRPTASTRPRSTTSTPRSCTCSASTTRS